MKLIGLKDKSLDKYEPGENTLQNQDQSLNDAMELLYDVMNGSYQASGTCLEDEYNGQNMNIQDLYWRCKELLDKINKAPDKTGFLAMSVLELTWERARPLALCSLDAMMSGDFEILDNARRLEQILSNNIYKQIWAEKSETYIELLRNIGFKPDPDLFKDLTAIMDPLLDALTFYAGDGVHAKPAIYKIRDGKPAEHAKPLIARAMCRYTSEKDFIDAVMGSGHDCLMAFGAVEQTHAQVKDYFTDWYRGYPEERQRNMMRNENLTEEEYLAMGADYTRQVYLCVKSGGSCWLVAMPWHGDYYSRAGDKDHEYYYGKRASYAPYQIFYQDAAPAPDGSTMLAIKKNGYLLSDLMDHMSMAWYPAFLDETMKLFFNQDGVMPEAVDIILSQEITAVVPDDDKNPDGTDKYALVPVCSGVPAICTRKFRIRKPGIIFQAESDKNVRFLMDYFRISPDDIKAAPLLPEKNGTDGTLQEAFNKRVELAYLKILAEKIADLNESRWDARRFMVERIRINMNSIITMAEAGDLMPFMSITIDGTPVLDKDGNPVLVTRDRRPYDKIPQTEKTEPEDGRDSHNENNPCKDFQKIVYWLTPPTSSRPPVVWRIRPANAEQYALIAGCGISDLPELLKLSGHISEFYDKYKNTLPVDLANRYTALGYGRENQKSVYLPRCGDVNLCMTKKVYKTFDYFKK